MTAPHCVHGLGRIAGITGFDTRTLRRERRVGISPRCPVMEDAAHEPATIRRRDGEAEVHDNGLGIERRRVVRPRGLPAEGACLVAGCPCKDPRIVSHRRVAFFAAIARERGETADRTIDPDPEWRLPAHAF